MENPEYSYNGITGKLENNSFTIPSITKDTVVTITHNNNHVTPQFSSYDKPTVKTEEKILLEEFILNSENGWSKSWNDLEYQDENQNQYYYTVEEVPIAGYTTTYTNNEGVQQGDNNVINTAEEVKGYELPQTGGSGDIVFKIVGLLLCAFTILFPRGKKQVQCENKKIFSWLTKIVKLF